jgi:prephenate dehydrogenase
LQLADASHKHAGKTFRLAAGSFRDLTRISDSPPELWRDICVTNSEPLQTAISGLQNILEDFKKTLAAHDEKAIEKYFVQAREIRQTYLRATK